MKPIMTRERKPAIDANAIGPDPCSFWGGTRWRTVIKGCAWQCRSCGVLREAAEAI